MSTKLQNDQNRIIGMNLRIDKIGFFQLKLFGVFFCCMANTRKITIVFFFAKLNHAFVLHFLTWIFFSVY